MLKLAESGLVQSTRIDPEKANWVELTIFSLYRINIVDIISIKAQLSKAFSISPSEVDKMPFWEFEMYMKELEKLVKDENQRQQEEYDKSGAGEMMHNMRSGNLGKMTQGMMPKMPAMPKMPTSMSINVPKMT